uniref:DUF1618 domain-containing protein n=1 Tax=Oryza glaberrima TaxID=4538 RepID=I1PTS0_ORYGL
MAEDANPTATGRRTHSRCPLRAPGLVHQLTQLQNPTCRGLSELHPPRLFGFSFAGKPTTPKMQWLPLRRALSAAASVAARRALSTAAASPSRTPPWAMIYQIPAVRSTAPRAFFILADPPGASNLYVPDHLFDRRPGPGPDNGDVMALLGGMVCTTSGDGLLLLCYSDAHAPVVSTHSGTREPKLIGVDMDPDITRFVCNPITGELFRLPDIDGTKKTLSYGPNAGLLTRSASAAGHGPPDRYAVALLNEDRSRNGDERTFVMRRFLSQTGKWEKLVGLPLPSPLPLPRRMELYLEAVAFAGQLWWVDPTWGAISADPFSHRPELRFVELPRGSVWPMPSTHPVQALGMFRRLGVSEGRLRYVELSNQDPFVLSSFALDDHGGSWTMEHQVELAPLCRNHVNGGGLPSKDYTSTPRIGVIDPLNSSCICVLIGKHVLAVDMDMGKVLGCSLTDESEGSPWAITTCLKPCVLPPWLGSSQIPNAEHRALGGTGPRSRCSPLPLSESELTSVNLVHREPAPPPRLLLDATRLPFSLAFAVRRPPPRLHRRRMQLPLRRALSAAASASAPVRRALSAAAAAAAPVRRALSTAAADADASRHPGWVMIHSIHHATEARTPSPRASLLLAEPPCSSYLLLPDHLVDRRPGPKPGTGIDVVGLLSAVIYATSGDGLLLFAYVDSHAPLSVVSKAFAAGATPTREGELDLDGLNPQDQDLTRFVCNPITGELFRLPDIDGTKKTFFWRHTGLLTRSAAGHGPPDSYAVAMLREHSNSGTFHMWRFLSRTGKWDKIDGLPSPLPLVRRLDIDTEAVAFAGRLWWVDLTWGVISADPFSDRPELHFVELPRGSVWPMPSEDLLVEVQSIHRRVGVSEGRLRYVEVSDKDPFVLSSFALDDDGGSWTLEHRVALGRICEVKGGGPEDTPRIAVIDPLNSSVICVIVGKHVLSVDMEMGKVLGSSPIEEGEGSPWFITSILKSCVLPPWLASSKIPAAGFAGKHIEDIAVKSDPVQSSVLLSSRLYVVLVAGQSAHLFT